MSTFKLKQTADEVQVSIDNGLVAVTYGDQDLDEDKKTKARSNIGAASEAGVVEAIGKYSEDWVPLDAQLRTECHFNLNNKQFMTYPYTHLYETSCNGGDQFMVTCAIAYNTACAVFFSGEPSKETYLGYWGETFLGETVVLYTDEIVTVPANCKYVVFNHYILNGGQPFYVKKKVKTLEGGTLQTKADAAAKRCVEVTYSDSVLTMKGIDITLVFAVTSVNRTFALQRIITEKGEKIPGTDSVSPYVLQAVNNTTGSNSFPTGGFHGTENNVGNPTARCESYTVYADGEVVENADKKLCNYVLIDVVNYVTAGNTFVDGSGREVLKEIIHYKFDGSKLYITTEIEALEDLKICYYLFIMAVGYGASAIIVGESAKVHTTDFSSDISINEWIEYAIFADQLGQKMKMHVEKTGFAKHTSSESTGGSQFITVNGKSAWKLVYDYGENAFSMSAGEKTLCTGYWDWCPSNVIG